MVKCNPSKLNNSDICQFQRQIEASSFLTKKGTSPFLLIILLVLVSVKGTANTMVCFEECNIPQPVNFPNPKEPARIIKNTMVPGTRTNTLNNCTQARKLESHSSLSAFDLMAVKALPNISANLYSQKGYQVQFPADQQLDCARQENIPQAELFIIPGKCPQVAWNYEDQPFFAADGILIKILRTYTIIDWCAYTPGTTPAIVPRPENHQGKVQQPFWVISDFLPAAGKIQYTQIIEITDDEAPFILTGKLDTRILGKGDAAPFGEEDQSPGEFPFECDEVKIFQAFAKDCDERSSEQLEFEWKIFLNNQLLRSGTGDTFHQVVYPEPEYRVQWTVTDVFKNSARLEKTYQFTDGLAPVVYCVDGIASDISTDNRAVRLTPAEFDRGSYDNCTDQAALVKKLWHPVLNRPQPRTAEEVFALPDFIELGCVFTGQQQVLLYVMDKAGNFDYCTTHAHIQNNQLGCFRRPVTGKVLDTHHSPVESVAIEVIMPDSTFSLSTDKNGQFDFQSLANTPVTLRPSLDTHPANGVSTYDLVLISQHILGIQPFTNSWQYLAADVNRSGSVTTLDMVQIRQLILNTSRRFPNSPSWVFADQDYQPDLTTINLLPDFIQQQTFQFADHQQHINLKAIKTGDVNGSAASGQSLMQATSRHLDNALLKIPDFSLQKGEICQIPVYVEDLENLLGLQFTLHYHDLTLLNISGGIASPDNIGRTAGQSFVTVSWHSLQSHDMKLPLLRLTIQAGKVAQLHELLHITSSPTPSEAYGFGGEVMGVRLQFEPPDKPANDFRVFNNIPNPFGQQTMLGFQLPKTSGVVLQILNNQGQVVEQQRMQGEKGRNEALIILENEPPGIYYCRLVTPFGTVTRKITRF